MPESGRFRITLLQVVIVVGILAVCLGLALPKVRRIREAADRMKCSNNLKKIMLGLHNYADANGDKFPPGCFGAGASPEERLSWMVELLPYLEAEKIYKQFRLESGYEENRTPANSFISPYRCPSSHESKENLNYPDATTYFASAGLGHDAARLPKDAAGIGFMGYERETTLKSIKDDQSNTIAVTETHLNLGPWARGGDSTLKSFEMDAWPLIGKDRMMFAHTTGINVAMADGSVRFVRESIDPQVWSAMVTIAGGEKVRE